MSFNEKTISSEIKYKGKILNLRIDTVESVNGESTREIVEHSGGAVVLPLLPNKNVVMIRQFRKPLERDVLEIPAGKIEQGESPEETAFRELQEETGYMANNMTLLTKMYPSVGYSEELLYIYLATDLEPGETDFDENEDIDTYSYHIDDLYEMVMEGKIQDAKTQVAILMTVELLRSGKIKLDSGVNNESIY